MSTARKVTDFVKHLILARMEKGRANFYFFNLMWLHKNFGIYLLCHEQLHIVVEGNF